VFVVSDSIQVGPSGARSKAAASRLLGLPVRFSLGAWFSVLSVVCCQLEVSALG
jgi:hypothetical protein